MDRKHDHDLTVARVRDGAIRFLAAIGPKQDDPSPPPPALRTAFWAYLEAIGPKQDDPHVPPPPPEVLRPILEHTRRFIEAIGPKQDDPIKHAIFACAVARFADEIGPKQDEPHHPPHPEELAAFRAWAVRLIGR